MHHQLRRHRTANGRAFHVRKDAAGAWRKTEIPVALNSGQRTQLVLDKYDNAYAVMPFGRIVAASRACGWTDWTMLFDGSGLNAFGEVVVDETRVAQDGVLSFMYQRGRAARRPRRSASSTSGCPHERQLRSVRWARR